MVAFAPGLVRGSNGKVPAALMAFAAGGDFAVNSKAPLSQWLTLKKLSSQSECKAKLKTMPSFYRCVSSDDPALKRAAKPKSAPSTSTAAGAVGTHMQ